jgi:4-carboxymuconolactone decarboxylase
MKLFAATVMLLSLLASACAGVTQARVASGSYAPVAAQSNQPQKMTITRSGERGSRRGPEANFTGNVSVEALFPVNSPSRMSGGSVTFEPGARSAWHTHPLGQILIVTAGTGWVQQEGGEKQEIKPGDVIWTPPGVKHWHGATATNQLTHIAIQESLDGKNVEWMEKVSEDEYKMTDTRKSDALPAKLTLDDVRMVAPALARYTQGVLVGDLWKRGDLSPRDRSLVTVAVLIARNQTAELSSHLSLALENGVKAAEISEVITHLAFYSGWANAMSAVAAAKEVFRVRGIAADQLPPASGPLLPIHKASEARRAAFVEQNVGPVAPGVVQYTSDPLFHDLWLRPALTPRDRSLVTVSALIASGQVAQLSAHLNRAMDNGLTKAEASELLTHLLFYAGWPNVFSAIPVAKDVFEKRPG